MRRIKLREKLYELCTKTYPDVDQALDALVEFIQNNYRRRAHKPYVKKGAK